VIISAVQGVFLLFLFNIVGLQHRRMMNRRSAFAAALFAVCAPVDLAMDSPMQDIEADIEAAMMAAATPHSPTAQAGQPVTIDPKMLRRESVPFPAPHAMQVTPTTPTVRKAIAASAQIPQQAEEDATMVNHLREAALTVLRSTGLSASQQAGKASSSSRPQSAAASLSADQAKRDQDAQIVLLKDQLHRTRDELKAARGRLWEQEELQAQAAMSIGGGAGQQQQQTTASGAVAAAESLADHGENQIPAHEESPLFFEFLGNNCCSQDGAERQFSRYYAQMSSLVDCQTLCGQESLCLGFDIGRGGCQLFPRSNVESWTTISFFAGNAGFASAGHELRLSNSSRCAMEAVQCFRLATAAKQTVHGRQPQQAAAFVESGVKMQQPQPGTSIGPKGGIWKDAEHVAPQVIKQWDAKKPQPGTSIGPQGGVWKDAEHVDSQVIRQWDTTTGSPSNTPKVVPIQRRLVEYTTAAPVLEWTTAEWGWDQNAISTTAKTDWELLGYTTAAPDFEAVSTSGFERMSPRDVSTTEGSNRPPGIGPNYVPQQPDALQANGMDADRLAAAEEDTVADRLAAFDTTAAPFVDPFADLGNS